MASLDLTWPTAAADIDDGKLIELYSAPSLPWLRINFVSSLDGAATRDGLSGGLSSDADKRVFEILRRLSDVVIVGAGTVRTEGYGPMRVDAASQAWRVERGLPPHPVFAIVSGSSGLDPTSRIFTEAPVRPIVITTESAPAQRLAALNEVADTIVCGETEINARVALAALADRGLVQQLCEGGPQLFGSLLAADLVDELCLTFSPSLEAGDAQRIANGVSVPRAMSLAHTLVAGDTLVTRYLGERS